MIRIAICDDEKHMSDHIRAMASDFFRKKNREIQLRTFLSGEELLNYDGQIDILGLFLFVLFVMEVVLSVWMVRRQTKQSLVEQMRARS